MTEISEVRFEMISPGLAVASYMDEGIVLHRFDKQNVVFEPEQLGTLRDELEGLHKKGQITASLGKNCLGEEAHLEWDGSTAYLYNEPQSYEVELNFPEVAALEDTLFYLGY